jgi:transcription elongation factor Elf1
MDCDHDKVDQAVLALAGVETATGFCPNCQLVRNIVINIERQRNQERNGATMQVEIATANCDSCGSFISRQRRELADEKSW